jgi:large subunit ribosomal protein L22
MAETTTTEATLVRAQSRYVRGSARKARVVLEHIRGKSVVQARATLAFVPRAAAREILATLESAAANAENNHDLEANELRIIEAYADEGPTLKRWQPRARGRAMRIRKRTCHLTLVLRHDPKLAEAAAAQGGRRSAAAATTDAAARARRTGKAVPAAAEATATEASAVDEMQETPAATEAPKPRKRRTKAAAAETATDEGTTEEAAEAPADAPAAEAAEEAPAAAAEGDDTTTPTEEEV